MKPEMNEPANFDEAFREWAERPPATSASDAARAVVARLQAAGGLGKPRLSPAWATLVAAVLVLVAGTVSFIHWFGANGLRGTRARLHPNAAAALGTPGLPATGPPRRLPPWGPAVGTPPTGGPTTFAVPARDADVVLWLDDGTPVYVFLPGGD